MGTVSEILVFILFRYLFAIIKSIKRCINITYRIAQKEKIYNIMMKHLTCSIFLHKNNEFPFIILIYPLRSLYLNMYRYNLTCFTDRIGFFI